jgi:t-SNARE complex subunit (syntaxin)
MKPYKDRHINLTSETQNEAIKDYTNIPDKFNIKDVVNTKKQAIVYEPKPTEKNVNNPFSNW